MAGNRQNRPPWLGPSVPARRLRARYGFEPAAGVELFGLVMCSTAAATATKRMPGSSCVDGQIVQLGTLLFALLECLARSA